MIRDRAAMYEAHFGLHSRPFGSKAEGPAVFTGPQQAQTIRGLHQGLVAQDAVVTVAGPTGVGKTTIVGKALESIKPNRMAAWIGRMHLSPDELLDLLLAGFGAGKPVQGSIRRFALFRRIMAQRAAAGTAIAVVVEDARRLGVETLAELEALTAADTGDSAGANIILMGPPELAGFLKDPALARLKQRVRRREKVGEFSQAEIAGYLRHCLRQAGGDYDAIFDPGVDQIIYRCSEGVARVMNTLAENVLQAAAEKGLKRVTTGLMHEVASDNYTYEGPPPEFPAGSDIDWEAPPRTEVIDEADAGNDSLIPDEKDLPLSARNIIVESGRYPELPDIVADSPIRAAADREKAAPEPEKATAADDVFEIPELINDTQPELSALPMPKGDEAVALNSSASAKPSPVPGEPVKFAAKKDGDATTTDEEEKFDLDAALSIDVEDTNVMEGITPNLDRLAAEAASAGMSQPEPAHKASPPADDLPTLSNSMRVDVAREVKRARQALPTAKPAPAVPKTMPAPAELNAKATTAVPGKEVTPLAPKQEARPAPAPPKPDARPVAQKQEPLTTLPTTRTAHAGTDEDSGPAVLEPEPEFLALMDPRPEPDTKPEQAPEANPGQSEMTRRIAAIGTGRQRNEVDALEAALDSAKKRGTDDLLAAPPVRKSNGVAAPAPGI
ncbi:MAG: hypothetical protein OEV41_09220, partial [Gammaproteobacteria bacterium]|nr:hypothetical protein [Gammaproteobacteria bacterium]